MFRLILTTNINIIVDVAVLAIQISFHICPLIPFVWILSLGLAWSLLAFIAVAWNLSYIRKTLPVSCCLHDLSLIKRTSLIFPFVVFRMIPQGVFCSSSRSYALTEKWFVNVGNFWWVLNRVTSLFALVLFISSTRSFALSPDTISSIVDFTVLLVVAISKLLIYAIESISQTQVLNTHFW